jgi:uncharacterized protein (DUF302 family)
MVFFISGLLLGGLITAITLYMASPSLMLLENRSRYNFEESVTRLQEAVEKGGWKIPAVHDLQATLLKFGKEKVNSVKVFEICNPDLAEKILKTNDERIVSALMPCRVAVYEKDNGEVYFSRMNSGLLSKPMGKVTRKQMSRAFAETEEFLNALR